MNVARPFSLNLASAAQANRLARVQTIKTTIIKG